MTIEFNGGWLDDIRGSGWWNRWGARPPSKLGVGTDEERWEYLNDDGEQLFASMGDQIITINSAFLEYFTPESITEALLDYAEANKDDGTNGAHCRAALSSEEGNVLTVEQGMHQPEDNDDSPGFCLHVTIRLTASTEETDQIGRPRHAYVTQKDDGSLKIDSMT
jgi:hypothetical protein